MLERFTESTFDPNDFGPSSTAFNIVEKHIRLQNEHEGKILKLSFIDVNGRESLKKDQIYLSFFEDDASAVILVYDISDKKSFGDLRVIIGNLEEFFLQNQSVKKYLIANKQDLLGKGEDEDVLGRGNFVSSQEGEEFSRAHGFNYCELSSKSGFDGGVDGVFVRIVEEILPACRYNLNFAGAKNGRMGQSDNYMYCVSNKGCNACSIF